VIANGAKPDVLGSIFAGEPVGTFFISNLRLAGKRRWIAYVAGTRGRLIVNAGARAAIMGGKASLLSSGVVGIEKQFEPQDVVSIADCDGQEFARGIVNCASTEVRAELESAETEDANRRQARPPARVLVTRDNIVLLEQR
jgi:glutamate 5-kinase